MEMIKGYIEDNALVIALNGHIDSSNAADVEKEINQLRDENTFENVYLDAENLEYISSAGLRIILRLRKNYSELKIMNVHPDVYEILDMTGFTEMIDVEKAYRRLSVTDVKRLDAEPMVLFIVWIRIRLLKFILTVMLLQMFIVKENLQGKLLFWEFQQQFRMML